SETGPPEMLMELAYRLAVEESPLFDSIRKNVIVMLSAAAEPDGRDRYVDWYYKYKLAEENENDRTPGPPYWGKYIFHDNNRDINYSQVTMSNWLKFYLEWHPPIMHDLHESQPLLYTFSGQSPQNPTLDPILYAELPLFSDFEMTKMIGYGMPGVWTHAFVDMWSPDGGSRVVSASPSPPNFDVEHAQQHQLLRDRCAERAGTHRGVLENRAGEFLPEESALGRGGVEGRPLRIRDERGAEGHDAR